MNYHVLLSESRRICAKWCYVSVMFGVWHIIRTERTESDDRDLKQWPQEVMDAAAYCPLPVLSPQNSARIVLCKFLPVGK